MAIELYSVVAFWGGVRRDRDFWERLTGFCFVSAAITRPKTIYYCEFKTLDILPAPLDAS